MNTTYGNRIPPVYRWAVAALVLVPLGFMVWAAVVGLVGPTPTIMFTVFGVGFFFLYSRAGTVVTVDDDAVRLGLFPLWRARLRFEEIQRITVESVRPLDREWGTRGSLRGDGEIFVDAGHSTTCLACYLVDGSVIRLGVSSPEHACTIAAALPRKECP